MEKKLVAVLFDLDGVITDTAKFHYQAWKKVAIELGGDIDENFNDRLKGVSREDSLSLILEEIGVKLSKEEFYNKLSEKNTFYLKLLDSLTNKDILDGIDKLFEDLKKNNVKIAVASASKNAPYILEKIGLLDKVDEIADPNLVENGKPAPDIFLLAANLCNAKNYECIGIEDAQSGIDALNSSHIKSVGVGLYLENATITVSDTSKITIKFLENIFNN